MTTSASAAVAALPATVDPGTDRAEAPAAATSPVSGDLDCYAELGVSRSAVAEDLRRSYRRRALAAHPDKGGSGAGFARLCRAYSILSDQAKRAAFDAGGIAAVALLEDESLRCRLEAHFAAAMQKTLAAAGLIFLDAEVLHPRFKVIQKTRQTLRRPRPAGRPRSRGGGSEGSGGGGGGGGGRGDGGNGNGISSGSGSGGSRGNGSSSSSSSSSSSTPYDFHLYTASPLRVHASLIKAFPFVRDIWPTPAAFAPVVVGNLSLQAHALLAAVEVAPGTGFVNVEIAQRVLADSAEGKAEGLGCPICGEPFAEGRPLRMHLMSPRHGLDKWALRDAIQAAQRRLVYCPLEGVTGRTKAMAAEARRRQRELTRREDAAWEREQRERQREREQQRGRGQQQQEPAAVAEANRGAGSDGKGDGGPVDGAGGGGGGSDNRWGGTAVGHGRRSGTYQERDEGLLAARWGDVDRLRELRAAPGGWDPCAAVDALGSCALHWAAGNGHLAVCKFLVEEAGVDPATRCTRGRADGRHALHWAARNGRLRVMAWLAGPVCGLSVNDPTFDGTTPFHWAVWRGRVRAAAWLARHGADTRARNRYGCNGSHWAALTGDLPMLRFLDRLWSFELEPESAAGAAAAAADGGAPADAVGGSGPWPRRWVLSAPCMAWLREVEVGHGRGGSDDDCKAGADAASGGAGNDLDHDDAAASLLGSFAYADGAALEAARANPFRVANAQGHSPLSKAAYAGRVQACEFFLGVAAADAETAGAAVAAGGSGSSGLDAGPALQQQRRQQFARLRVPRADLLLPDGNGFRPADIARCAGFERIGDWLSRLAPVG